MMVAVPPLPSDTFSGVSGCRKPGVMVSVAVALTDGLLVNAPVIVTCTLLAVRYEGGVYWPVEEMEPAPELASPPETVQVTVAAPPLLRVAVNCSTGELEEFVALQPVQFVSIVPVPGVMENSPFEAALAAEPPQPASANTVGSARAARSAAERRREIQ